MIFFSILNMLACLILLWHAACVINSMTRYSNHLMRIAYILIAVGSLGLMGSSFEPGETYQIPLAILTVGVAMVFAVSSYKRKAIGLSH